MIDQKYATPEKIKTYRDLIVWSKSIDFVTMVYELTRKYPKDELYGLTLQIRRCAISIPSNIAEGYGRRSTQDYIRFLQIAMGSLYEIQTQIQISLNLKFIPQIDFDYIYKKSHQIEILLRSLIEKIKSSKFSNHSVP